MANPYTTPSTGANDRAGIGTGGALNTQTPGAPAPAPAPSPPVGTATVPTPPPTPQPSPSVTVAGSGYTPDYKALLAGDPGYQAAINAASGANAQAAAQRQAQLRQMVIQFGALPPGFSDQYGDIDQATLDAAAANQQSTMAQLKNNYSTSQRQFMQALAARGALQSGDFNYGQDQLNQGEAQQEYDAANTFGSSVDQQIQAYLSGVAQQQQNVAGALSTAEQNEFNLPQNQPVAALTANYDPASTATYGQPIYKGDDGTLYDQYGNPYTPPAGTADGSRFGNAGRNYGL